MASISASQVSAIRNIRKAESSAWDAVRLAEGVSRLVSAQLAKLEADNASLHRKIKDSERRLNALARKSNSYVRESSESGRDGGVKA
jgi:hypothetical protein